MKTMIALISPLLVSLLAHAEVPDIYQRVGAENAVPSNILYGVCSQESAYTFKGVHHPWPWTLNISGKGFWYDQPQDAVSALQAEMNNNNCRVDIGLCQIHWCAHSHVIKDPIKALNPYINIQYAASILREQFERSGDWYTAIGWYHSPNNPKLASKYRDAVVRRLTQAEGRGES